MFESKLHFFFQDQIFFRYPVHNSTSKISKKCASVMFKKFLEESEYKNKLSEQFRLNFSARYEKIFDGFNYNLIDKNNLQKTKLLQKMAGRDQDDYKALRYFYKEFQKYYTHEELMRNVSEQKNLIESFFSNVTYSKPIGSPRKSLQPSNKRMYMLQSDYYKWIGIPFFRNIFNCFPKYEDMIVKTDTSDANYDQDLVASKLRFLLQDSRKDGISNTMYMIPNIKKQQVAHNSYVLSKCIARALNNDSQVLNSEDSGVNDKFYFVYQDAELTSSVDAVMAKFRHLDVRKVFFVEDGSKGGIGFASNDGRHVVVSSTQALYQYVDNCH